MKKFLLVFGLILSLTAISSAKVGAEDVPDFLEVDESLLTFTGKEVGRNQPKCTYGYDCDIDFDSDIVETYMDDLVSLYDFRLIGHYVNDYRRGQAKLYERWIFVYTGSKRVATFEHKNIQDRKNPYYCQLVVGRSRDWTTEITPFSVHVANGLTYGGD